MEMAAALLAVGMIVAPMIMRCANNMGRIADALEKLKERVNK